MNDTRREFNNKRASFRRKNRISKCAKCGVVKNIKEIEFHHINPIADGGDNEKNNLIPLCKACHDEFHTLESIIGNSFETFMNTPTYFEFAFAYNTINGILANTKHPENLKYLEALEIIKNNVKPLRGKLNSLRVQARKKRQTEGIAAAKEKGVKFGRPSIEYPKEFIPTYRQWKDGELKAVDAMRLIGLKKTTFYKLVKQYEENGEEK